MYKTTKTLYLFVLLSLIKLCTALENHSEEEIHDTNRHVIEGKALAPDLPFSPLNWQTNSIIHLNGGEYLGFIKADGSFTIHNVPSGSYVLEVINPDYMYEPVRVEINSKGKYRARKLNHIQTSQVIQVPYPLRLKPLGRYRYFQVREQWRVTDFLFNPMILMMVLPLLLIMVWPKMMSDPETKKEMEQFSSMTKFEMPEMSELMTSLFTGPQPQKKAVKSNKKRQ